MNLQKRFALTLALVTVLCLAAGAASAATISAGRFTLPAQAYWGATLLPAGEYSLSLMKEPSGIDLVIVRGEGVEAILMTPAGSDETSGHRCLKVDDIAGTYVVREFDTGATGRTYRFAVSKAVRDLTLRGSVTQPLVVPVSAGM